MIGHRYAWLVVPLLILLVLLINPVGYVAGGGDDSRYLEAARCWAESGAFCVPSDHWQTRWPALAPLAAAIDAGGISRTTVGLGSIPPYLVSVIMVAWLGRLWFGRGPAVIAAALFATVPAVSVLALKPNVDLTELSAQLAALGLATGAIRRESRLVAVGAGAAAGLAIAARETSLLFAGIGIAAWLALAPDARRLLLYAIAGLAGTVGAEMLVYLAATGNPLLRFELALAHGGVPSAELAAWVDTSRSPILNPDYIAGWKRSMGIELWWPLDPWLNLFASPQIGPWLLTAPLAVAACRTEMSSGERRKLTHIGIGAVLLAAAMVYVLAIDPKVRAFLLPLAAATLALGWALDRLATSGKGRFAITLFGVLAILGLFSLSRYGNIVAIEQAARRWIARHPGRIEIDQPTRATLALVKEVETLPTAPAGRPLRLIIRDRACGQSLAKPLRSGKITLVAAVSIRDKSSLCLVRYLPSEGAVREETGNRAAAPGVVRP